MENTEQLKTILNSENIFLGYIWLSDQKEPIVVKNEQIKISKLLINPFVIEGNIIDKTKNISYTILHNGNDYNIYEFNLSSLPASWVTDENDDLIKYQSIIPSTEWLYFQRYWKCEIDLQCNGMSVYKPAAIIFIDMN